MLIIANLDLDCLLPKATKIGQCELNFVSSSLEQFQNCNDHGGFSAPEIKTQHAASRGERCFHMPSCREFRA